MKAAAAIILCLTAACAAKPDRVFLPPEAIVKTKVGNTQNKQTCSGFQFTEDDLRTALSGYHTVTIQEQHDFYAWSPCTVEGSIEIGKRFYHWQAREGNLLTTDYPDGILKTLGGAHTDNPAGE